MNPYEVTRILVKFAPQDRTFGPRFAFDATAAPGYVWHCHILEHEENDMMRPLLMQAPTPAVLTAMDAPPVIGSLAQTLLAGATPAQFLSRPELLPASPNPLRTNTMLRFALPTATQVDLRVFDVQGKLVRVLASGLYGPGEQRVNWNGDDEAGRSVAKGVYFVRLRAGGVNRTQRVVLAP